LPPCDPDKQAACPTAVQLQFEVRDTGIGIPADKHQAIFEPFEQVDGSTTRKYGGTGLGLAISAQLVELMGGHLWVDSEVGRGSRFHFKAAFQVVTGQEAMQGPIEPPDVHGLRVLVVDDNATHREILQEMFSGWRMQATAVSSVGSALEELRRAVRAGEPYQLLLADAVMPPPDGFALAEQVHGEPGLVGATILMLNSSLTPAQGGSRASSAERCREAGVRASIMKPLKQSELLDTILGVVSTGPVRAGRRAHGARAAEPLPALPPLRVLLAEDNVVNQRLALRILEKAGHTVRVAGTGGQALQALERDRFDVVLMDVQMPEMGGLEATAAIRQREKEEGGHTPVIALTAHAMKGDRERCLAAGMDGYVAKPIRERELFAALEQVLKTYAPAGLRGALVDETPEQIPGEGTVVVEDFDRAAALERCGEDPGLLRELIDMFLAEIPGWMATLDRAVRAGEGEQVKRMAHTIKGAVGTFGATPAWEASFRLETLGRENALAEMGPAWQDMQAVIERLKKALAAFEA
jgi:CheY-like chemotaxis protein/HPt (histidine-containing phosphotransfer) domain-containing protein